MTGSPLAAKVRALEEALRRCENALQEKDPGLVNKYWNTPSYWHRVESGKL